MEKLKRAGNRTPYKILITITPPKPNRDGEEALKYLAEQGWPHFSVSIPRLVGFQRGPLEGVTIDKLDRQNLGWQCYESIGEDLIGSELPTTHVSEYARTQV